MPLPLSGAIRLGADVNVELGLSATAQIALGQASVRSLFAVPTGAIRLAADSRGKSAVPPEFTFAITSNQTNANLRTLAVNAGWDQSSKVVATVNAGVYIYSTSISTPGLTIDGSWPGGVELVNNGFIIGMGGGGGVSGNYDGAAGGPAVSLGVNVSIRNNSYIAGGGGGGGGVGGGGGAGGGAGGGGGTGTGGAPGVSGANGSLPTSGSASGGGGGRVLPGAGGAGRAWVPGGALLPGLGGGAGGGGGMLIVLINPNVPLFGRNASGGGGGWGAAGGTSISGTSGGSPGTIVPGNGGSASAAGGDGSLSGSPTSFGAGGAGGNAVRLNGYSVTWLANGTRYGAIS